MAAVSVQAVSMSMTMYWLQLSYDNYWWIAVVVVVVVVATYSLVPVDYYSCCHCY
jgi:hypothetical protein